MAQLVVRNLDDDLKERLRRRAASNGRSMEEEARLILHRALPATSLPDEPESHLGLGSKIHALFMDVEIPDEYFSAVEEARGPGTARPRVTEFDG